MKNNKISPGEGRVQEQGGLSSNITFCGRDSFQCNQTGCTVSSGDSLMKPAGWKWWCDDSQSSWGRQGDFSRFESKHNNILSTNTLEESALVRDSHVTVQTLDGWLAEGAGRNLLSLPDSVIINVFILDLPGLCTNIVQLVGL